MNLIAWMEDEARQARVLREGAALIDGEVAARGGVGGFALKAGYAAIKRLRPDIIEDSLRQLFPYFAPVLQRHVDAAGSADAVPKHFRSEAAQIADDLLAITDEKARSAQNRLMKKTYASLRGQAHKETTRSMPAVGDWLGRYASEAVQGGT